MFIFQEVKKGHRIEQVVQKSPKNGQQIIVFCQKKSNNVPKTDKKILFIFSKKSKHDLKNVCFFIFQKSQKSVCTRFYR